MRVLEIEKEASLPPELPAGQRKDAAPETVAEDAEYRRKAKQRTNSPKRRGSLARFLIGLILILFLLIAAVAYLVLFIAGPLVRSTDSVPSDFPQTFAIYRLEEAAVSLQSAASKERIADLIAGLPGWALSPFVGYLTTDLKTQIAAKLRDPNLLPDNLTMDDLNQALAGGSKSDTVGLQWNDVPKTKEELYEYYKSQLLAQGFTVKEKMDGYEIDLSFFKPGMEGAMSIADSFMKDDYSVVKMTIDYLSRN